MHPSTAHTRLTDQEFVVRKVIFINTRVKKVWEALTNPEYTKKYFFHCQVNSDWKTGSPIIFTMEQEGVENVVMKGQIQYIDPEMTLSYSIFTPEEEPEPKLHTEVSFQLLPDRKSVV